MEQLGGWISSHMDNFSVKKKLYILYIACMLLPLLITDSVLLYTLLHAEQTARNYEMESMADGVKARFTSYVEYGVNAANGIYTNSYINEFLNHEYQDSMEYVAIYQSLLKVSILEKDINNMRIVMYADNDTIINGGYFQKLEGIREESWYKALRESKSGNILYFDYDGRSSLTVGTRRKMIFAQKLDYYGDREKVVKLEIDYSRISRDLRSMGYHNPVYICNEGRIILSNTGYINDGTDYEVFNKANRVGCHQTMELYGEILDFYVLKEEGTISTALRHSFPLIFLLVTMNLLLPFLIVKILNHSFTVRLQELSDVFRDVEKEALTEITNVRGKDEIGCLMCSYNKMAARINFLIQTVYKNRLREQEITVARQNAELLALHSQINPHFLFNALESIRMHSILRRESETAGMVEMLAVMLRQYVEWGNNFVDVSRELEFAKAYLSLQKYRFGDRLTYEIKMEKECGTIKIPKLTLVTFVENACVHGIEGKTAPGWIFVRVYQKDEMVCMEVEDTGNGMPEAAMEELQEHMNAADIGMLQKKERVGIINACLRLKMMSANQVRFELDGEEGAGMMVSIWLPQNCVSEDER